MKRMTGIKHIEKYLNLDQKRVISVVLLNSSKMLIIVQKSKVASNTINEIEIGDFFFIAKNTKSKKNINEPIIRGSR
jgi:hypothetical protein